MNASAVLAVIGVFWLPPAVDAADAWRSAAGLVSAVLAAAGMLSRWRLPVASTVTAGAATVGASVLGVCQDPMLAAAWCLYPLALTRAARTRMPLLVAVGTVAALAMVTGVPAEDVGGSGQRLVLAVTALSVAWLLGAAVGRQVETAREAERARAAERTTRVQLDVARDVHDVVGHALGVISAEAGVTRGLSDATEQELRDTLADIEQHARSALEDIQALVRSLRTGDGSDSPGLSALPPLIAATRAAGLRIDTRISLPDGLPPKVGATAFRIVQESLANAVRHAPGAACTVDLHTDHDTLVIRIRDEGPGMRPGNHSSGFGLRGMRERARLIGGTVTWRDTPGHGFEVEARLPLDRRGGRPR